MPAGCRFQARCGHALAACGTPQAMHREGDTRVRCGRAAELGLAGVIATTPA
jgi:peptide/nickel transport system ATP-binding protein